MSLPVRPHVEAEPELLDAVLYYAERSRSAAVQFLDVVDDALVQIAEMPRSAPAWPGLPDVRRRVLKTYPYAIVYAIEQEEILILAFEHVKRRPGYWLRRVVR